MGVSGNGVMDFKWLLKWILVNLNRFDFSKVVFDINMVLIAENGNKHSFLILEKGIAKIGR